MAKQTFTTGQVLTAAQMTNLQQTAMLGGDANARTASYVLVAGDAGNAVTMSSTSTTTITVNTGIFAAGDIVTIVNINSGVCTITAGTATVTTSGSLALSQNQGGILRFTSASAAIFLQFATPASGDIEGITTGANSGLTGGVTSGTADLKLNFTAKGQLPVGTGSGTTGFLTVGTNGHTLVADSAETTGLKWQAASSGGWTLLSTTTLSGATTTLTVTSGYKKIVLWMTDFYVASGGVFCGIQINANASNYTQFYPEISVTNNTLNYAGYYTTNGGQIELMPSGMSSSNMDGVVVLEIDAPDETNMQKTFRGISRYSNSSAFSLCYNVTGVWRDSSAVTSLAIKAGASTWSGGTAYLYGVK
jgi:hypothetical protein